MSLLGRAALAATIAGAALVVPAAPAAPATANPGVEVRSFGAAPALGAPTRTLADEVVDLAAPASGAGYWVLGRDGGVFSYGVPFHGSTGGMRLNAPVVGMAATPAGDGYWFVGGDGGVFTFGAARFAGSTGNLALQAPIVAMAATPTGDGYWLAALDGGVFAFGDAPFHGSALGRGTAIVGIAGTPSGKGYVLLGADGSLHAFGDAPDIPTVPVPQGAVDVVLTGSGRGAWVLGADGAVYAYGDARFHGAATSKTVAGRAIARAADGGYWVLLAPRFDGPPLPADSGSGRRVVYSNPQQRVWLVEDDGRVAHSFLVSGRRGVPAPGTYRVFSRSPMSSAHNGSLRLPYMTRFAWGRTLAIGFHGIPLRGDGTPIQSDAELGQYRSAGCVRMNQDDVRVLWDFAPVGTTVVVTP